MLNGSVASVSADLTFCLLFTKKLVVDFRNALCPGAAIFYRKKDQPCWVFLLLLFQWTTGFHKKWPYLHFNSRFLRDVHQM